MSSEKRLFVARLLASTFGGLTLLLGLALVYVVKRAGGVDQGAQSEAARVARMDQLARNTAGIYDSHADPAVGRVLLPNLRDKQHKGVAVRSNVFGMREKDYVLPKPAGLYRIVLLGDSLVFGEGCPQDQRMGNFLQRFLDERARGPHPEVEVLHLGIGSWNVVGACEYLRRQLTALAPDLVVHVTTVNDMDDGYGVRGFGEKARFSDRHRGRADSIVWTVHPAVGMGRTKGIGNHVSRGLDLESRERYEEARAVLARTVAAVEERGGRWLHLLHWSADAPFAWQYLFRHFPGAALASLPREFWQREDTWVASDDPHWNPLGMRLVASLLYGMIRAEGWLEAWDLAEDPEAEEMLALVRGLGREQLEEPLASGKRARGSELDGEILAASLADEPNGHFNGGIDGQARLGAYASLLLGYAGERTLVLELRGLARAELAGLTIAVTLDEFALGTFAVPPGELARASFPVPEAVAERRTLGLRLEASDYGYENRDLQHCVAAELVRVALE